MEEENKISGETPIGMAVPPTIDGIHITEMDGKRFVVIGAGVPKGTEAIEAAIRMARENNVGVIVNDVDAYLDKEKIAVNLDDIAVPILKKISELPIPRIIDSDVSNKIQLLRDLNLSPEQIDYFQNAPPNRLEGESFEDYKTRRMLNKLLIKYRGINLIEP